MVKKILWALVGGVGGTGSIALSSLLTKLFNPQGNYILAVVFSAVAFTIIGICVTASVTLASPIPRHLPSGKVLAIVIAGCLAGVIFPWGVFGFYLAFLLMGALIALVLNGFSRLALKDGLFILGGFLTGWAVAFIWLSLAVAFWQSPILNSEPVAVWLPFGLMSYGFTLGLLLSGRNR